MAGKLNELLMSPDDKVRLAAVKVFSTLSYNLLLSSIGKQSLEALADRCKDPSADEEKLRDELNRLLDQETALDKQSPRIGRIIPWWR